MNQDILEGKWNQVKGKVRQQWGELTDDDLSRIHGKREEVLGLLQERYGWSRERAESDYDAFVRTLN